MSERNILKQKIIYLVWQAPWQRIFVVNVTEHKRYLYGWEAGELIEM